MANSGFYTNRIPYSEMLELFEEAAFEAEVVSVNRSDRLPIQRSRLSPRFQKLSDEGFARASLSCDFKNGLMGLLSTLSTLHN